MICNLNITKWTPPSPPTKPMIIWLICCWLFPALNPIFYSSSQQCPGHETPALCSLRIFFFKNLKSPGSRAAPSGGPGPRCCGEEERSQTETITASLARHRPPTHNPQPILSVRLGDKPRATIQPRITHRPTPSIKSRRSTGST